MYAYHDQITELRRDVGNERERASEDGVRHLEGDFLAVEIGRVVGRGSWRWSGRVDGIFDGLASLAGRLFAGLWVRWVNAIILKVEVIRVVMDIQQHFSIN